MNPISKEKDLSEIQIIKTIKFNKGFSFPDVLVQDFLYKQSILPSFKKCERFDKKDLSKIIESIKKKSKLKIKKKKIPKRKTNKKSNSKKSNSKRL